MFISNLQCPEHLSTFQRPQCKAGDVAQLVDHLSNMQEALDLLCYIFRHGDPCL